MTLLSPAGLAHRLSGCRGLLLAPTGAKGHLTYALSAATSIGAVRSVSTSVAAARRRGDDVVHPTSWRESKSSVMPPPGWEPTLVDRVVSTTAADVMRRPCVIRPKPDEMVHYVKDSDSVKQCATIFWEKRIGALLVKSEVDGSLVGIMSERDFVKALATDTTHTSTVGDLMTPVAKMVTVSLTTGVGECMELMRQHGIRHLPVMATGQGENQHQAVQNLQTVAERCARPSAPPPVCLVETDATLALSIMLCHVRSAETTARKQFNAFATKLCDAFGEPEGRQIHEALAADPDAFSSDERPLLQRASAAAAKLNLAEERLAAVAQQASTLHATHPVGIISIRDLLLTMTANQVVPLLDWLNEERRTLIEERVGYSE